MIIKTLEFDDYLRYKETIRSLMIDSYMVEFELAYELSTELINERLTRLDEYLKKNAILIAAIEEDTLIGFVWIFNDHVYGEERFHFNEIIVDKRFRGQGIGEHLMKEALRKVEESDTKVIELIVSENNQVSMNLCKKYGFITERRILTKKLD